MQFNNPGLVLLFLILPLLLILLIFSRKRSRKRYARYADEDIISHHLRGISSFNTWMKMLLLIIALSFVIIALLQPQWDHKLEEIENRGLDIIFCMDISRSMDASDLAPSRLERAKLQAQALIDKMAGDRVGVIAFAGAATLQCPLTTDYDAARMSLSNLNSMDSVKSGSNIGQALRLAKTAFDTAEGNSILILISDGEDLENQGLDQAARLAASGIRIFTIGTGNPEGAVITNPYTAEEAITKANPAYLQKMAAQGQGQYYDISSSESALSELMKALRQDAPGASSKKRIKGLKDQYHIFVMLAMMLVIVESLIIPLRSGVPNS